MNNRIIEITSRYPTNDKEKSYGGIFYHTRNIRYIEKGIDVTVINSTTDVCYELDGVKVITIDEYKKLDGQWKLLICHAPDRNTYNFLKRNAQNFKHIFFVIHGNEVLKLNRYYKKEYSYLHRTSLYKKIFQGIKDELKVRLWGRLYSELANKSEWIFVSKWMYEEFVKNIKINEDVIKNKSHIIYNCVADVFENETYNFDIEKKYDFVTIRGNFDTIKYGVDIVNSIAKENPEYKFLIIGKGKYFDLNDKANNLTVKNTILSHEEIKSLLLICRIALMPTRHDAQGVMMCEMATYGIPVITSNIPVCREVLDGFENVFFLDNDFPKLDAEKIFRSIKNKIIKNQKFYMKNTCDKEIELIYKVAKINE